MDLSVHREILRVERAQLKMIAIEPDRVFSWRKHLLQRPSTAGQARSITARHIISKYFDIEFVVQVLCGDLVAEVRLVLTFANEFCEE
jgi:hypothetical protein